MVSWFIWFAWCIYDNEGKHGAVNPRGEIFYNTFKRADGAPSNALVGRSEKTFPQENSGLAPPLGGALPLWPYARVFITSQGVGFL